MKGYTCTMVLNKHILWTCHKVNGPPKKVISGVVSSQDPHQRWSGNETISRVVYFEVNEPPLKYSLQSTSCVSYLVFVPTNVFQQVKRKSVF